MKPLLLISILCSPVTAIASDAYFVRFLAFGKTDGVCTRIYWRDDILFYNTTDAPLLVRFLGISGGTLSSGVPDRLSLGPHQMLSLNNSFVEWGQAGTGYDLRVIHLDVPAGVVAESRDEFYKENFCITVPPPPPLSLGKVSMPIFRALTPPNIPQVILGSDLGGHGGRTNIGVYNAGATDAVAKIEVRRACDNALVDSRSVIVPADSIVQFTGFQKGSDVSCSFSAWARYTVITVDQPSLSYVANITEAEGSGAGALAPTIELAVAHNVVF